jgi:hypothetical protein
MDDGLSSPGRKPEGYTGTPFPPGSGSFAGPPQLPPYFIVMVRCISVATIFFASILGAFCATSPGNSHIEDRATYDDRQWLRRTTSSPNITYSKLVPASEAFHAWEERIELARIPLQITDDTMTTFTDQRKRELQTACRTGRWKLLKSDADSIIYEFEHRGCDPYEFRVSIMQRKENRGTLFVYRTRKILTEDEKAKWIEIGLNQ